MQQALLGGLNLAPGNFNLALRNLNLVLGDFSLPLSRICLAFSDSTAPDCEQYCNDTTNHEGDIAHSSAKGVPIAPQFSPKAPREKNSNPGHDQYRANPQPPFPSAYRTGTFVIVLASRVSSPLTTPNISAIRRAVSVKCCTSSRQQRSAQNPAFPVGEPLLEDLVAAELVVPHVHGDVAPIGVVVQVDVEGGVAEGGWPLGQGRPVRWQCRAVPPRGRGPALRRRRCRNGPSPP